MTKNLFADNLPSIKEYIGYFGLDARKKLGQNFILDANILLKIANASGSLKSKTVIEIGSGPGGLTRAILSSGAKKVLAFEKDERAISILNEIARCYKGRLDIIHDDALNVDFEKLIDNIGEKVIITANLPYNIATVLLIKWLKMGNLFNLVEFLNLMFQKEVALRMIAQQSSKDYGRLSLITNLVSTPRLLFDIDRSVFVPKPKVTSSLVQLIPKPTLDIDIELFEDVTRSAFNQRRKMIKSSLSTLLNHKIKLDDINIDESRRAQELSLDEYIKICHQIDGIK